MMRRVFMRAVTSLLQVWATGLLHADPRVPKAHWHRVTGYEWEYRSDAMTLARVVSGSYPQPYIAEETCEGRTILIEAAGSLSEIKQRVERHYRKYAIPG